jgi:hypothetical protein
VTVVTRGEVTFTGTGDRLQIHPAGSCVSVPVVVTIVPDTRAFEAGMKQVIEVMARITPRPGKPWRKRYGRIK